MIEKKIVDFDPTNLEFTFNFTKDTCAKLKTGICELDEIGNSPLYPETAAEKRGKRQNS